MNILTKEKSKNILSNSILVVIAIMLFFSIYFLWNRIKDNTLSQISENTSSKVNYYANEIELKHHRIEFALEAVNKHGSPMLDKNSEEWDEEASFYIQNFAGLENIAWVDINFFVKNTASSSTSQFTVNQNIKDLSPDANYMYIWIPTYQEDKLAGYLFGEINISDLALSVVEAAKDDYVVQISENGNQLFTSNDWDYVEISYLKSKLFSLKNTMDYMIAIKPSVSLIKEGSQYSSQVLHYGLVLSGGVLLVIWLAQRSIRKSKQLEEMNTSLQKQLINQQKLDSIGMIASGVAHEISNPINGVLNYGQLIIDSNETSSENSEYAKEIMYETNRVSKLVKNLLQFSKQQEEYFSYVRLEDIIDKSSSLMRTILKKDQIGLEVKISGDLPEIQCRSHQIQQVIVNLLANSRDALNDKYTNYDEDKIILLSAQSIIIDEKQMLRIIVEDHGNGIPLSIQSQIFNSFFTTKDIDRGTGLGLPISYKIVQEHRGKLSFETEEGEYTRFLLDLPCNNNEKIL